MGRRGQSAFMRMARLEFRHAMRLSAIFDGFRYARVMRGTSGCLMRIAAVGVALFFIGQVGLLRTELVPWYREGPLAPRILPWLLWTLAGLYAALGAGLAGWGAWDRPHLAAHGQDQPPITDLLPIAAADVLLARIAGRGAGLLTYLLISLAGLAVARTTMVAGDMVREPPSLLDPWLIGAPLLFAALFAISTRMADAARRWYGNVAGLRFAAYFAVGGPSAALALKQETFLESVNGALLLALATASLSILALAVLQGLPSVQWLEQRLTGGGRRAAVKAEDPWARMPAHVWTGGYMSLGTRGLGGMRGRDLQWVGGMARLAAGLALAGAVGSVLIQVIAMIWVAASSRGTALPEEYLMDFLMAVPTLGLFGMACFWAGGVAWSEATASGFARWRPGTSPGEEQPHLGEMLPALPERVWPTRLVSLLAALPILAAGAVLCLVLSQLLRDAIDPRFAVAGHLPVGLRQLAWLLLGVTVGALAIFLITPMLCRARKLIPMPTLALGCLGWVALMGGMIGAMLLVLPPLYPRHAEAELMVGSAPVSYTHLTLPTN